MPGMEVDRARMMLATPTLGTTRIRAKVAMRLMPVLSTAVTAECAPADAHLRTEVCDRCCRVRLYCWIEHVHEG